jgi:phosphatidylethanolamine/phosphatidyl-N-methylethanolamine N-methyltransferase
MSGPLAGAKAISETREVERVYAGLARVYDTVFDWTLRPGRLAAVRAVDLRQGHRVLEVGVGTGLSLGTYPVGADITGIDISEPMLEHARIRAGEARGRSISIRRMDAQSMNFRDGVFDYVIAPYVISVVPDPHRVMAEIARVCRPGGTVIVVNHFVHEDRLLRYFERWATPLTRTIGFRLDTRARVVTRTPDLDVCGIDAVNLFGWWKLVLLKKRRPGAKTRDH